MSHPLAALVVLALAAPAFAAEKDALKPPALTPKESADGWVLLFDGESTFGWKIDGAAEVKDGKLIIGTGKKTTAYPTTGFGPAYRVVVRLSGKATIHTPISVTQMDTTGALLPDAPREFLLDTATPKNGTVATDKSVSKTDAPKQVRPELAHTPFAIETDGTAPLVLFDVRLKVNAGERLFTGKTLDGWKVNAADPKRMASKWAVTRDGELALKNGPGDLVTEKEFDNFVLQLECKTLGKALNSGVFFRCIPGQYQNGYEAQIHNGFKGEDRTKPVDFGTGAIYRRVPARRVVSDDNEWFTLTVVADGKHFATWVNGYQTVDWTDDRKANENPRQGFRAAKGPISLQGHDPTTDILFRHIRIAELPK